MHLCIATTNARPVAAVGSGARWPPRARARGLGLGGRLGGSVAGSGCGRIIHHRRKWPAAGGPGQGCRISGLYAFCRHFRAWFLVSRAWFLMSRAWFLMSRQLELASRSLQLASLRPAERKPRIWSADSGARPPGALGADVFELSSPRAGLESGGLIYCGLGSAAGLLGRSADNA